jgi:MoxR-like ATPase
VGERWTIALTGRTVVPPDVVGRDFELAQLRGALDAASAGKGGVLFLVGEAGIGKSRLAQVLATEALDRGLPVLRGRATQVATPAAYRPNIPIAMAAGRLTTSVS